jgi:phosphoribosylamine-glycine ligase
MHARIQVVEWAKSNGIDFVVVGPEDPLTAGVVDELEKAGIYKYVYVLCACACVCACVC